MADETLLPSRFADLLRSAPCQRIDFWCGGLHVNGAGFTTVAHGLGLRTTDEKQGIGVLVGPAHDGGTAQYDPVLNNIVVSRADWAETDAFERQVVVHELTHALRDVQGELLIYQGKRNRPRAATDEATAYVAGYLFDVYVQQAAGATAAKPERIRKAKAPIHSAAYDVALRLAARPAGSIVGPKELNLLFHSVQASYLMHKIPLPKFYGFNGVPGLS